MVQIERALVGEREVTFETGRMAKQASGSVIVRLGDTMVLVTAQASAGVRPVGFMPLTCEYQARTFAAGRIP